MKFITEIEWKALPEKPTDLGDGVKILIVWQGFSVEVGRFADDCFYNEYGSELKEKWIKAWAYWPVYDLQ